ncbi:hypothetical protein, partial [Neisseria sp. P0013.S004]|uniref:hypothetical protein n=1 Tax=Neisseria sp. P0013.S004 TaxID=3436740 RepID=UPI003F81EF31
VMYGDFFAFDGFFAVTLLQVLNNQAHDVPFGCMVKIGSRLLYCVESCNKADYMPGNQKAV